MNLRPRVKYNRIIESMEDVAYCTHGKLALAGGTALALFYLNHRVSVDLDFIPLTDEKEEKLKEMLKGALSRLGYKTLRSQHTNQFVLQFEDISVKIEVFRPDEPLEKTEQFKVGRSTIKVAVFEEILKMKIKAYQNRKEARDLYDILFILEKNGGNRDLIAEMIAKYGFPQNLEELRNMAASEEYYKRFEMVVKHASKTGSNP